MNIFVNSKFIPIALVAGFLLLSVDGQYNKVTAGTCAAGSSCGVQPIKFVPGQRITVEVVNLTQSLVQIQQLYGTDAIPLVPGQVQYFVRGGNTNPNFSATFWDIQGLPLKLNILKTDSRTLRVEVRYGARIPGDRSVYLQDDGRVDVL